MSFTSRPSAPTEIGANTPPGGGAASRPAVSLQGLEVELHYASPTPLTVKRRSRARSSPPESLPAGDLTGVPADLLTIQAALTELEEIGRQLRSARARLAQGMTARAATEYAALRSRCSEALSGRIPATVAMARRRALKAIEGGVRHGRPEAVRLRVELRHVTREFAVALRMTRTELMRRIPRG